MRDDCVRGQVGEGERHTDRETERNAYLADSSDVLELLLFCVFVGVLYVSWSSDF